MDAFADAMERFREKVERLINANADEKFPNLPYRTWVEFQDGRKFARIVEVQEEKPGEYIPSHQLSSAAYGFVALVDGENKALGKWKKGDVFMAEGWKAPARHVRGTIYDDDITTFCGPYGIKYLR